MIFLFFLFYGEKFLINEFAFDPRRRQKQVFNEYSDDGRTEICSSYSFSVQKTIFNEFHNLTITLHRKRIPEISIYTAKIF